MDEQIPDYDDRSPEEIAEDLLAAEEPPASKSKRKSKPAGAPIDPENRYSPKSEAARARALAKLRAAGR